MSWNRISQGDESVESLRAQRNNLHLRLVKMQQRVTDWENRRPQILRYMQALGPLIRETQKAREFLYESRYNTIRLDEALRALENGADTFLPQTSSVKRALEDEYFDLSASISSRARKISRLGDNQVTGRKCASNDRIGYAGNPSIPRKIVPPRISPFRLTATSSAIRPTVKSGNVHSKLLQSKELMPSPTNLPSTTRSSNSISSAPFKRPLLRYTISPTRIPSFISASTMEPAITQPTQQAIPAGSDTLALTTPSAISKALLPAYATMATPRASGIVHCPSTPRPAFATLVAPASSDNPSIHAAPRLAYATLAAAPASSLPPTSRMALAASMAPQTSTLTFSLQNPGLVSDLATLPPTPRVSYATLYDPPLPSPTAHGSQLSDETTTSPFFTRGTSTAEGSRRKAQR